MKAMIDTSALIGTLPESVILGIHDHGASYLVRAEMVRGLRRFEARQGAAQTARVRRQLIATLDSVPGFWRAFDGAASDAYASLVAQPESAVRAKDAFIAAHALALGVPLMTADLGFTRYVNVDVQFV